MDEDGWLSDAAVRRLQEAADAPDLSGTRYRLVRRVGRGGMGSVYLAEDTSLARRVALKVLDVDDARGDLAERLVREARILARLEHPGIVPVHDVGRLADGRVFYAMRFVEGERLDRHVAARPGLPERLRLFLRVCEAVAFAHSRGVLHRDLKPENVMVGPFGEVLVMDWGVAKLLRDSAVSAAAVEGSVAVEAGDRTGHGSILGTPGFMSPEQARGETDSLDARSDVWALGSVLRFLLEGGGPQPLRAICAKAMEENPAERYPSALDLAAEVTRHLDGRRVEAYREGLLERARRLYARHRVAFWLVATYLLVRGALLVFLRR